MELLFIVVLAISAFMFLGFWGGLFALLALVVLVAALKG
jgi:hypothetical protein